MNDKELFRGVYDQVLDYDDEDVINRCADFGYGLYQMLGKHSRILTQGEESSSSFMYAVVTAVMIGEFAKRAYNDYFSDEAGIDLDLLDVDFGQVEDFLEQDMEKERFDFLEGGNTVGLQDMWTAICEWKQETYKSLAHIYEKEGKDPDYEIYQSFVSIFSTGQVDMTGAQQLEAYEYLRNETQT